MNKYLNLTFVQLFFKTKLKYDLGILKTIYYNKLLTLCVYKAKNKIFFRHIITDEISSTTKEIKLGVNYRNIILYRVLSDTFNGYLQH